MKLISKTFLAILFVLPAFHGFAAKSDLELIRRRFIAELMAPEVNQQQVAHLMENLQPDGTWANIDYQDVSRTGFRHGEHLANMVELSRAYKKKNCAYRGDKQLKSAIYQALNYWLSNDFICENWWWNQIGTPNALVSVLLIMDEDLTKEQVAKILPIVGRAHLEASGARPSGDRIKIAGILAKSLLFQRNEAEFNKVVRVIEGEIKFATGRGMQYDYSFHHREDRVNNTLSYGVGYADAFAEWAASVAGTSYQFSEEPLKQLTDYYLDGICKMMPFGKYPDAGATNRDITRRGSLRPWGTKTPGKLLAAGDYRKPELEEIVKIRKNETAKVPAYSAFFWQTEHYTHQRPGYFTSVRMFSTRNRNMEVPYNGEGLMNHHRGDGTNYISRTGTEYRDMAPVYDWQKIPGATILQKPELPSENEIQKEGSMDFVGAVTDGQYGAVAFDFKSPHDPLKAKKAWFFFDKEYVCMGTAIQSRSRNTVVTTLNQCLLNGEVVIMGENGKSTLKQGEHEPQQVKWIFHDGIGYLFPEPQKVKLANQVQSGSWYKVNRQTDSPKAEVKMDVFKLWLDHGSQPENGVYSYIVIPSATETEMEQSTNNRDIEILANNSSVQAVKHSKLNIYQVIFYTSGEIQLSESLKIGIDSPGIVMIKEEGAKVSAVSVADPGRKLGRIHLTLSEKTDRSGENFRARWEPRMGATHFSIDLPQGVYAGKSVTINL